ncbi:hypothetical protein D3C71_1143490 [compost metagenome]
MQAHVEHVFPPALVLAFLRAKPFHQLTQHGKLCFGHLALFGLMMRQHVTQLQMELKHLGQAAVTELDGQQRAKVERHLLQRGIDFVQPLADRLARLGTVSLQCQQVVLALVLQQVKETLFMLR